MVTTCAYCGVGCSFKAEMQGNEVVRMVPFKDGKANHGHSCVKGPLRLGLRHAQGPHPQAHDPRQNHRSLARSDLGRSHRPRGQRIQAHPGQVRPRFDRRHHLFALHERRNLSRPEDGSRRLRQQQRRYLRARLPFAHGLRAEDHARHLGRNAGFRFGRRSRRHHDHRRESHRRASGFCLADEAPAARGRAAHRRRSAPHRSRQVAAR